ncbi:MAG: hypothetical protein OXR66_00180 [Candidatus Woesearchaeota archaeon]|nr:hypothetical protein [Candidatus Woesearchaeota archaeon]
MGNAPYDTKDVNDIDRALRGLVKSADIEGFFGTQHTGVYPLIACEPFEEGVRARGSTGDVNPFALFDALPFDRLAPEFSEFAAYAQHRSGDGMVAHTLGEAVARIIEVHMHAPTLHEFYVPKTP